MVDAADLDPPASLHGAATWRIKWHYPRTVGRVIGKFYDAIALTEYLRNGNR